MTKEVLIDSVLLRLTGGRLTPEATVLRADIGVLIPGVVNRLMMEHYALEKQPFPQALLLQAFEAVPVQFSAALKRHYLEFPRRVLTLPQGAGVQQISTPTGLPFQGFNPDSGTLEAYYLQTRLELPLYAIQGERAIFYNLPAGVDTLNVLQLVHIEDLQAQDEILLPSGGEVQAIELLTQLMQHPNPQVQ